VRAQSMLDERQVVGAAVVELVGSAVLGRTVGRDWVGWCPSEEGNGRDGWTGFSATLVVEEVGTAPRSQVTKARRVASVLLGRPGDQLMKCRWAHWECQLRLVEAGQMGLGLVESSFHLLMAYGPWLAVQEQWERRQARSSCWCGSSQARRVLVVRRLEMLTWVVLKVPLRDEGIRRAGTGEPCCFAIDVHRPALPQPKADGPWFLLPSVLTVPLKGEATRPTMISGRGSSVFCLPRPGLRRPTVAGHSALRR
jgi:hypothetical protein